MQDKTSFTGVCLKQDIIRAYQNGKTAKEIADALGRSRQSVDGVLRSFGIDRKTGGAHRRAQDKLLKSFENRIFARMDKCSASPRFYLAAITTPDGLVQDEVKTLIGMYNTQRRNFLSRSAPFDGEDEDKVIALRERLWSLSFDEWFEVWHQSGKLNQRGRGKHRYCLIRKDNTLPFTKDNIVVSRIKSSRYISAYLRKKGN